MTQAPEGILHLPLQDDNNSATHCCQEVGGALFDLPQTEPWKEADGETKAQGIGEWPLSLSPRATPRPARPNGNLVTLKEALSPLPGSKPFLTRDPAQPRIPWAERDLRDQFLIPVGACPHTHTHTLHRWVNGGPERTKDSPGAHSTASLCRYPSQKMVAKQISRSLSSPPLQPILIHTQIRDKGKQVLRFSSHQTPLFLSASLCVGQRGRELPE